MRNTTPKRASNFGDPRRAFYSLAQPYGGFFSALWRGYYVPCPTSLQLAGWNLPLFPRWEVAVAAPSSYPLRRIPQSAAWLTGLTDRTASPTALWQ